MIDHVIQLDLPDWVDFWGVANQHLDKLANFFPTAKLILRGNTLKIQSDQQTIQAITSVLEALLVHYQQGDPVTAEMVQHYIQNKSQSSYPVLQSVPVITHTTTGKPIRPRTPNQMKLVEAVNKNALTFVEGVAGTGKTYLAVALALASLKRKEVSKILITRPIVETGENLGFLPGYLEEKTAPYLYPIYDALDDMISFEKRKYYQENNMIEVAPLAYMRGRTLHHAFVILDEAQNTTTKQMKMFLTRMGLHSKFIITGDKTQIDLPYAKHSGLIEAIKILQGVPGIAFAHLDETDIVRHPLIKPIIEAYQASEGKVT